MHNLVYYLLLLRFKSSEFFEFLKFLLLFHFLIDLSIDILLGFIIYTQINNYFYISLQYDKIVVAVEKFNNPDLTREFEMLSKQLKEHNHIEDNVSILY